jgi:hypothetical protein
MFKYIYRTINQEIADTYKFHTGEDIFKDGEFEIPVELVVVARNEDESFFYRTKLSDIKHWYLYQVEEL